MYIRKSQKDEITPQTHDIEVAQGKWETSTDAARLTTYQVSSCAVVAVHSADNRTGYLGHFEGLSLRNSRSLSEFFRTIELNEKENELEAWVGGATVMTTQRAYEHPDNIYNCEMLENKLTILKKLGGLGVRPGNIRQSWLDVDQHIEAVAFEPADGSLWYCKAPLGS